MKRIIGLCFAILIASPLLAQKYGATPEDSVECIKNLSIYQEFYKQKAYTDAYPAWKEVQKYCPSASLNNYIRGNVILKQMIAKDTDPTIRQKHIEELMSLWDLRIENYGRPGYCMGMKGRDMRVYMPDSLAAARAILLEAMKNSEEKDIYPVPFWYLEAVIDAVKAGLLDKEEVLNAYERAAAVLEKVKAGSPNDTNIDNAMTGLDALLEPYASCTELVSLYEKKYESNKTNLAFLKKATIMLDGRGCTSENIFFKLSEALHAIEPTAQSAYLMAKMCYAKKYYKMSIDYIAPHAKSLEKDNEKINAYMLLADSYLNLSQFSAGRDACTAILAINPNEGRAYLMLGNLYAAGAKSCGDGTTIGQRAPYWAAVDKFVKAKQLDPSVAETADKLIAAYRGSFPSGDELFTYGLKEGDSYSIHCWFVETTTIRSR